MKLYHFSESEGINRFIPRPVAVPSIRPRGQDWLNGPLVWAIDDAHEPLYLFPRECPRVLIWPTAETSPGDRRDWFPDTGARMLAYAEEAWWARIRSTALFRYELPPQGFEDLHDAGMWVTRHPVLPLKVEPISDLPAALHANGVELRLVPSLSSVRGVWSSSLHASGIRLRNAMDWPW